MFLIEGKSKNRTKWWLNFSFDSHWIYIFISEPFIYLNVLLALLLRYVSPHSGTFSVIHCASSLTSVKVNTALLHLKVFSNQMF